MKIRRRKPTEPTLVSERTDSHGHTARLFRNPDGSLSCQCPYACLATYERCEFSTPPVPSQPVLDPLEEPKK